MTEAQAAKFLIEELPAALGSRENRPSTADSKRNNPALSTAARRIDPSLSGEGNRAENKDKLSQKITVLATRMMLQLFSVPSLMAYLADAAVVPTNRPDGSVKVQLDFIKLPKEILPEMEKLLSTDYFKDHKLLKYIKNGQARTGLEIEVTPKDLPGDAFDYAY